jgi:UDP-2-acetamido-2-deoxy-ribo-hexuluronate aminotransferase
MMALNIQPDDEIITTPFTFIATAETIAFLKAKPVFVDIDEKTYNMDTSKIEEKITSKTKAIIAVSLYGQPCDIDAIQDVIDKVEGRREKAEEKKNPSTFNLQPSTSKIKVIIDGAQSFGSTYKGKTDSNLGDISTTSFFPAKPLGCYGDGGAVFTNDDALADKMRSLRVHGQSKRYHHKYIGMGGRMDTLQCAIVDVKLKHYKKDLALRQEVAKKYNEVLKEKKNTDPSTFILLPSTSEDTTSAWAQYSVRVQDRDTLQAKLKEAGIPTAVHYPMPLHLQECFEYLGYKEGDFPISEVVSSEIMSLPMNPYVTDEEIAYIVESL